MPLHKGRARAPARAKPGEWAWIVQCRLVGVCGSPERACLDSSVDGIVGMTGPRSGGSSAERAVFQNAIFECAPVFPI